MKPSMTIMDETRVHYLGTGSSIPVQNDNYNYNTDTQPQMPRRMANATAQ